MELLLSKLLLSFDRFSNRNAFFIQGKFFTYSDFEKRIGEIQNLISKNIPEEIKYVGLLTFDDLETYASIYALWFLGKAFVPVNPNNPVIRNARITEQMKLRYILHSGSVPEKSRPSGNLAFLDTSGDTGKVNDILMAINQPSDDAYVLFTSGTTGEPKGVPISRNNLNSYITSYMSLSYTFTEDDRFLQIYDLSFDASVPCYTFPLMAGACIYTVPQNGIKYLDAYRLIEDHKLTFIKMTPSTLAYLQPYFNSIKLEHVRYCMLGGESFSARLASAWENCVPNALIQNVYGPTEATVFCLFYNWNRKMPGNKSYNKVVSIGRTFGDNYHLIIDEKNDPVQQGIKGELCISGSQITTGYWNDQLRTEKCFFELLVNGEPRRFYKTGDIVFEDPDGDIMFCGRMDSQVQIQGYRVELGEVEKYARDYLGVMNLVALAKEKEQGVNKIFLFTENMSAKESELLSYLSTRLPHYMIPSAIINLKDFPMSSGGKIDRKSLLNLV